MSALEEAKAVRGAFQTYKACRRELEQEQEQKQVTIPEFIFPTPDSHPNPNAKKDLEAEGFVHRRGAYGVGYYADNVR